MGIQPSQTLPLLLLACCVGSPSVQRPPAGQPAHETDTMEITGVVHDASGAAVGDAVVTIFSPDRFAVVGVGTTARDGKIHLVVPIGEYMATATAPDHLATTSAVTCSGKGACETTLVVKDGPGIRVTGTVSRLDGKPAAGATVRTERRGGASDVYHAIADRDGHYSLRLSGGDAFAISVFGSVVAPPSAIAGDKDVTQDFKVYDESQVHGPIPPEVSRWITAHAIHLKSVEPDSGQDDLQPVAHLIGNARVIGLGEATHGTHEFFTLKHRLFRYLVEQEGFTALVVEANLAESTAVNDYVLRGTGDAAKAIEGLHFWITDTEEMLALVHWMREYNASSAHQRKIRFYGCDVQYASYASTALLAYIQAHDSAFADQARETLSTFQADDWRQRLSALASGERAALQGRLEAVGARLDGAKQRDESWTDVRRFVVTLEQTLALFAANDDRSSRQVRDSAMAANVLWALEQQGPHGRVAVWAANGHISRIAQDGGVESLGYFLSRSLGRDYFALGLLFGQGGFQAYDGKPAEQSDGVIDNRVGPPPSYFFEAALASVLGPTGDFIVPLRDVPSAGSVADWFALPRPVREYGAMYLSDAYPWYYQRVAAHYDAVAYVSATTRAHPTPTGRRPGRHKP